MQREQAVALLSRNALFYPSSQVTTATLTAYAEELTSDGYEFEAVARAFAAHRRHSRFWPAIAELWDEITAPAMAGLPAWGEAWIEVLQAARSGDPRQAPAFSAPIVAEAVRALPWEGLVMADVSALPAIRAQFREIYAAKLHGEHERLRRAGLPAAPVAGSLPAGQLERER